MEGIQSQTSKIEEQYVKRRGTEYTARGPEVVLLVV
jgi:hypothetical protein